MQPDLAIAAARAELARISALGFAWGQRDCGTAAGLIVLAATGVDPCAAFRGRYSTELGCVRALRKLFGTQNPARIVEILAERHGWVKSPDWRVSLAVDVHFKESNGMATCPAIIGIDGEFTVFSPGFGARQVSPENIAANYRVV
jgi:hypothetical protein